MKLMVVTSQGLVRAVYADEREVDIDVLDYDDADVCDDAERSVALQEIDRLERIGRKLPFQVW